MEIVYSPKAIKDRDFWKKSGNLSIMEKISSLLISIEKAPYKGMGRPEPLKHRLSGMWSSRISKEHRLIYEFNDETKVVTVHSLRRSLLKL